MGFKQHISRTWQMIEQQVNDVPFRPDDEELGQIEWLKMGVCRVRECTPYANHTPNDVEMDAVVH